MLNPSLMRLMRVANHLKSHDEEMTLTRLQVLLHVARADSIGGTTVIDLMKKTGRNQSTISRALGYLASEPLRGAREPLKWVSGLKDPSNPRALRYHLTSKGEKLLSEIETLME